MRMTDTHNESKEPEQGEDSGGSIEVGERLRKAREDAGIDINEMAGRLRLTSLQLEDIEAGRLEQFGASIYARGYVANYARLLGLRAEPLVERLALTREQPPLEAASAGPPAGQRLAENFVRVATYAVGTIVLVLPVLWWASEGSLDALFGQPTVSPVPQEIASTGDEERTESENEEASEPRAAETDRNGNDKPLMASMGMPRSSRDPEPTEATVPEAAVAEIDETPPGRLVLDMAGDSWVEIRDAAGERLEYDLLKEGTTREYTGTAPYRVLIGNAEDVRVRYNDAPFDVAPYVQGNLARFEVGEEPTDG